MALKPCVECKKEISTSAKACPHCGKPDPHVSSGSYLGGFLTLAILIGVGWFGWNTLSSKTPEERAAQTAEREAERAERKAQKEAKRAEDKRKGFHCLSSWDGSHRGLEKHVRNAARNPDSFEHIRTSITPVDQNGEHVLFMSYRAENGFGGMSIGEIRATVNNETCIATIVQWDNG